MTSQTLKTELAALGIKARVRDFGNKLRIAPTRGDWASREDVVRALNRLHATHGLTNCFGRGFDDRSFNLNEVFAYKAGAIRRVA